MPIVNCTYCYKEMYARPCRIKKAINGVCCSRKCSKTLFSEKHSEIRICEICESPFKAINGNIKRRMTKCCSRICLKTWWKRNRKISLGKDGYRHMVIEGSDVREHRHIMQQHLGRKLNKSEYVHHINRDKADNRLENLEVMTAEEHTRHHAEERYHGHKRNLREVTCKYCGLQRRYHPS